MNLEKLKPWNWFKHENNASGQIPVANNAAKIDVMQTDELQTTPGHALGSLIQLRQDMDRLFDDAWRSFGFPAAPGSMRNTPLFANSVFDKSMLGDYRAKLNIAGSGKEYEVSIDLPGLAEDDLQIELSGNVLTIRGHKEESNESKDKQYYCMERRAGSFQRILSLPEDADAQGIAATMKKGVLTIKIPRKALPQEKVKRISISS